MSQSFDSGTRPINARHYRYESASAHDHEFDTFTPQKKQPRSISKWLKIGLPILVVLIAIGVVVGVVVSKHHNKSSTSSTSSGGGGGGGGGGGSNNLGVFYTATDGYGLPVYPSTVRRPPLVVHLTSLIENNTHRLTPFCTVPPHLTHQQLLSGLPTPPRLLLQRRP